MFQHVLEVDTALPESSDEFLIYLQSRSYVLNITCGDQVLLYVKQSHGFVGLYETPRGAPSRELRDGFRTIVLLHAPNRHVAV